MELKTWLAHAQDRLASAGVESPRLEAQVLAAHVLGVDRSWLLAHPEHDFNDLAGESLLLRRESREPLAYILGFREFYGRPFRVTPAVLVPRQDTETLIETALQGDAGSVLDIGTGSGIIAVTLQLERPDWEVTGVDLSASALEVARSNAESLGAKVRFILSDGFAELTGESFDLIVSNPPYIGSEEPLMPDVVDHEPHLALFSGPTGFEFYERLADEAMDFLNDGGQLIMEVGYRQAERVRDLFAARGWRHVKTAVDLAGIERVVVVGWTFQCATAIIDSDADHRSG